MSNSLSVSDTPSDLIASESSGAIQEFLRFQLQNMTALFPLQQLTEVLPIPINEIVPISHMPAWVMGVYNWRGEILWIVDLNHLVGLAPWYQQPTTTSTHTALVLQIHSQNATFNNKQSQMLGLIVNQVEDIEPCNPDLIQPPPSSTATAELAAFLRGYWLKQDGEMLTIFDGAAIMAAMPRAL